MGRTIAKVVVIYFLVGLSNLQLLINVKNQGGDVMQENITANVTEDTVTLDFMRLDGVYVSQLVDFSNATHECITETKLEMNQQLSVTTQQFDTIDGNTTDAGSQVTIKDEQIPGIDIKEEVTTEQDKVEEDKRLSAVCRVCLAAGNTTLPSLIDNLLIDVYELLSNTKVTHEYLTEANQQNMKHALSVATIWFVSIDPNDTNAGSEVTIKDEPLLSTDIKEEMNTEVAKLEEIGSLPEHSTRSRLTFEDDYS